jgi:tetratricopeptide (TPR) repeat protein
MTSAPEYGTEDTLDDVAARLCDETPGVMSLRYRDARIPGMLADVIRLRCPDARSALIPYQSGAWEGADGSVSQVIAAACREAAGRPSTIVLLFPDFEGSEARDPAQVSAFWKRLNSQREVLGGLHARVLVGISPDDDPFAHYHAMDLLSWCMPKFNVQAMQGPVAGDPEISQDLPERSLDHDKTSDADRLRQMAMTPLWKELVSSKSPLTAQRVEDVGLPLLDLVLSEGAIGEAEAILAAMEKGAWPRRLQAKILTGRGRLHQLKGHLDEALDSFHQALGLLMEVPRATPSDAGGARAICVTLDALAEAIVMRGQAGDAAKALEYYERSLKLREDLLEAHPYSAEAARDVSVSLDRLADFLTLRGQAVDATKALGYFERSLKLSEDLLAANPHSAQAARDVSVSLDRLADFSTRRGQADDATKALGYYERSLKLSEGLLAANPHSAEAARDVSVSLNGLADFLTRRGQAGDATKALGYYERSLKLSKGLLAANPHSAQAAHDVLVSLERMAKVTSAQSGFDAAQRAHDFQERALQIALRLREANPTSAFYGQTAAISFFLANQRAQAAGQEELAQQHRENCHSVLHELISCGCQLDPHLMHLYQRRNTAVEDSQPQTA